MAPTSSPIPLNKRALSTILGALFIIFLLSLTFSRTTTTTSSTTSPPNILASTSAAPVQPISVSNEILRGDTIAAGKIENATAKAELGRASWHTFHTIMAKFPDRPSGEEQTALASYIHLWARLYPWCASLSSSFFFFSFFPFLDYIGSVFLGGGEGGKGLLGARSNGYEWGADR